MARTRSAYPAEFRRQMVELVQAGRPPEQLARAFDPTAQSIRNWLAQSKPNAGRGHGGLNDSGARVTQPAAACAGSSFSPRTTRS
jgi:transposase